LAQAVASQYSALLPSSCPKCNLFSSVFKVVAKSVTRFRAFVARNMATCGLSFTRVRNTFIDTECELSPSLGPFLNRRLSQTCPAGRVGELQGVFCLDEDVADCKNASSPRSTQTGSDDSANELRSEEDSFQEIVEEEVSYALLEEEVMATPTEWDLPCLEFLPSGPVAPEPYFRPFAYDNGMMTNGQLFAQCPRRVVSLASALGELSDDLQMRRVSSEPQPACRQDLINQDASSAPHPRAMTWQRSEPLPVGEVRLPRGSEFFADFRSHLALPVHIQNQIASDDGMQEPPPSFDFRSSALPSLGSADHASGTCSPCAFFHAGRCTSGLQCRFCHLCDADSRKRLKKEKLEMRRARRSLR